MRALLVATTAALAATALPATPALADPAPADRAPADRLPRSVFVSDGGRFFFDESGLHFGFGRDDRDDRRDRRRLRGTDTVIVYDRDYQGDSAWRPGNYNDWWHERTERSYPRWLQNNQSCARKWWGGDTLRC